MEPTLDEGVQTKITEEVLRESEKISGEKIELVFNILDYIHKNYNLATNNLAQKRTRNVDEIINTKLVMGCTDYAHLFSTLCRTKKIPALFVDVLEKDWIKKPDKMIKGHVFVKINVGERDFLVDPSSGDLNIFSKIKNYTVLKKGVDFLSTYGSLENFNEVVREFRENYLKNEKE